ncbi:MAG: hypothetical protein ACLPND_09400 [Candidatus Korobacteraceae bacterium]
MQNAEGKKPTNGGTDGDDADIYRRAQNEGLVELAHITSVLLNQMRAVIDSTMKAVVMLPMRTMPGGEAAYEGYEQCLMAASSLIVSECKKINGVATVVARVLSSCDTPEAREHAESIQSALKLRGGIPE